MPLMPGKDPTRRDLMDEISAIKKELRALHKIVDNEGYVKEPKAEVVYSWPFDVAINTLSGDYVVKFTEGIVQRIDVTAQTPPSEATTLDMLVNGSTVHQTIIPNGSYLYTDDAILIEVGEWDTVQFKFTDGGDDMENIVVHMIITDAADTL